MNIYFWDTQLKAPFAMVRQPARFNEVVNVLPSRQEVFRNQLDITPELQDWE